MRNVEIRHNLLTGWLRRGLDLLFPPRCVACSRVGTWFCAACQATVEPVPEPICGKCGRPILSAHPPHFSPDKGQEPARHLCRQCRANPIGLDSIRAVAIHDGALRQAIHHLKYRRRRELASPLGEMLYTYWQRVDWSADVVVPVPLYPDRRKERGYNQAGLLARVLTERSQLALNETQLIRQRATAPQVGLGAQERAVNVRDAFLWIGDRLDGTGILLIDDVCTTGATLHACASALYQEGASSVWALTLARAR